MRTIGLFPDEYPTEEQLNTIAKWELGAKDSIVGLLDYVESLWWQPGWGFRLTGKWVLRLELHTAGWSGNEDIIEALQRNFIFWSLFWQKSIRGGHFWFRMPLP